MSLSMRVVVPPHPLIAHWLCVARDAETPTPLFRTAITELGRWLTYELLRDWLPHRPVSVHTPLGDSDGHVIDASVELAVVPILRAGLGLWEGGQAVLPTARVWHVGLRRDEQTSQPRWYLDGLPDVIGERTGVLVYDPMIATGGSLLAVLERLKQKGVAGPRLRVISVLAAAPGLRRLGEAMPDLHLHTACIDEQLNARNFIVPGLGDAGDRFFGTG